MNKFYLFLILLLAVSCSDSSSTEDAKKNKTSSDQTDSTNLNETVIPQEIEGSQLDLEALKDGINLEMDISQLSLPDIYLLRNAFAARQGYCFMRAELRAIFSTTSWYNKRMEDRFFKEEMEDEDVPKISYTPEEQSFINELIKRENELRNQNLLSENGRIVPNLNNIINLFQIEKPNPLLLDKLALNGFAIVPNNNIQLFHLYEQNDYKQMPNFVTTDMYLQLFHMYFGFVLKRIEEDKFIALLDNVCRNINHDMMDLAKTANDSEIRELAEYNATYYAIGLRALTGESLHVPSEYVKIMEDENAKIQASRDEKSEFLNTGNIDFPYSLFKPRGHYTRTESLKRYFKAMMWIQTANYCLDDEKSLKRAVMCAAFLNNSPNVGSRTLNSYRALLEPITFIIGEPDNISILDLAQTLQKGNYSWEKLVKDKNSMAKFKKELKVIAEKKNRIGPEIDAVCENRINFLPQRYLADNDILQTVVDLKSKVSARAYPKGLDVLAAFGSQTAEGILINELKEEENWSTYPDKLKQAKSKVADIDWNASLYNKWISSLMELQKSNKKYPYFMQNEAWDKKDLTASLASWAELKHDAILYAEQPMAAECGGIGPPPPYVVGYVEPNINYWNSAIELLSLTKEILNKHNLMTKKIEGVTKQLMENAVFLLSASKKELVGIKLTEREYNSIQMIGSTFEWLTLDLVKNNDEYFQGWEDIKGPDKSVSVIADIYTANSQNNPNPGILHVGTGYVNDIYVVVEIERYLFITRGAVLSYHEFPLPIGNRLTDEEWQKMLENNQAPEVPEWMKEIIVPIKTPKLNEKIFYSSGC